MKDYLNLHVKFREPFRPYAPSVLKDRAAEVFDIECESPYMLLVAPVRPEWRPRIPAVVHVDGTARPQIVNERDNPLYADILRRFRAATGLPVLVNTSFNVHEQPIVNRPQECLQALNENRVDFVVTKTAVYTTATAPAP